MTIFGLCLFFQVILQSETIQELTKTSQALDSAQKEASELRKVVDVLKTENVLPLSTAYVIFSFYSYDWC